MCMHDEIPVFLAAIEQTLSRQASGQLQHDRRPNGSHQRTETLGLAKRIRPKRLSSDEVTRIKNLSGGDSRSGNGTSARVLAINAARAAASSFGGGRSRFFAGKDL